MAQSLVEQAEAAGLEPMTHPSNASGYAGVHPVKNDKYQGRYWDTISKKQRPVPGLFDRGPPRCAAPQASASPCPLSSTRPMPEVLPLTCGYLRLPALANSLLSLSRSTSSTPVSYAVPMSSLMPFAHAQPLACSMPSMLNEACPAFGPYSAPDVRARSQDDALHM